MPGNTTYILYIYPWHLLLATVKSMHRALGLTCYGNSHPKAFTITTVSILVIWGPVHSPLELQIWFPDVQLYETVNISL